jgi:Peptidase family M1.
MIILMYDCRTLNCLVLVYNAEGKKISIDRVSNDTARQFFIIHLGQPLLERKRYRIAMSYLGNLNDVLQGFYRSSYTVNNQTR